MDPIISQDHLSSRSYFTLFICISFIFFKVQYPSVSYLAPAALRPVRPRHVLGPAPVTDPPGTRAPQPLTGRLHRKKTFQRKRRLKLSKQLILFPLPLGINFLKKRMHSSRMRTGRTFTVFRKLETPPPPKIWSRLPPRKFGADTPPENLEQTAPPPPKIWSRHTAPSVNRIHDTRL